jgi:hypothetical protein
MGRIISIRRNWHTHAAHATVGVGGARRLLARPETLGDSWGLPLGEGDATGPDAEFLPDEADIPPETPEGDEQRGADC